LELAHISINFIVKKRSNYARPIIAENKVLEIFSLSGRLKHGSVDIEGLPEFVEQLGLSIGLFTVAIFEPFLVHFQFHFQPHF